MATSIFSIPRLPNAITLPGTKTSTTQTSFNPSTTNLAPGGDPSKPYIISGLKAATPGGVGADQTNNIKSTYVAPVDQQKAGGNIGSYKGVSITPGSQADIQAQIARIDAAQNTANTSTNTGISSTPTQTNIQSTPTFPGIVGSLIQNSLTQSPVASTAAQGLLTSPTQNNVIAQRAEDIRNLYGGQIAKVGQLGAGATAGDLSTGTNIVGSGNAAIASQSASQRMQALAADEAQQLNALNPQLTAQAQGQNALTSAGGLGNTAQSQLQSGLTSAAGLAQPQAYGLTSQPYNPLSDTYGGGGTAGVLDRATLAGQVAGAQAAAAAPGQAQASNVNTAATTVPQANQSIYNSALNSYYQLQNTTQNIDQFGNLLSQTMQQGGINPFDVKYANRTLSEIRGQLSSAQQAVYDNTLATLRSRVSGLLAAGGSEIPSAITADAQKILDGSLPLSSLNAVLSRIQQEGNILLTNQAGIVNQARQGTLQGGSSGSGATNSEGWY